MLRYNPLYFSFIYALLEIKDSYCPLRADLLHIESTLKMLYQCPQPGTALITDLHSKKLFLPLETSSQYTTT